MILHYLRDIDEHLHRDPTNELNLCIDTTTLNSIHRPAVKRHLQILYCVGYDFGREALLCALQAFDRELLDLVASDFRSASGRYDQLRAESEYLERRGACRSSMSRLMQRYAGLVQRLIQAVSTTLTFRCSC